MAAAMDHLLSILPIVTTMPNAANRADSSWRVNPTEFMVAADWGRLAGKYAIGCEDERLIRALGVENGMDNRHDWQFDISSQLYHRYSIILVA